MEETNTVMDDKEQDNCAPTKEQVALYLAEPDDAVTRQLNSQDKLLVAKTIVYGRNIAQAQAEITAPIFYKEGIKEAVGGMSNIISRFQVGHPEPSAGADDPFEPSYLMIDTRDWQAKLKEWFKDCPELLKKWGVE